MLAYLLGLIFLALPVFGNTISFHNDREGESYYSGRSEKRLMNKALKQVGESVILNSYQDSLREFTKASLCSFTLNQTLEKKLKKENPRFDKFEGVLYYLRSQNEIDDEVLSILLNAYETSSKKVYERRRDELLLPSQERVKKVLPLIASFEKKNLERKCLDDAYKNFYSEILKVDKNLTTLELEALYYAAWEKKIISVDIYKKLEGARQNDLHTRKLTLKSYYQKISSLRTQFPLRDSEERSQFVSNQSGKNKMGRRQMLLENYSDIQIALMGEVIKKLRVRLESPRAEILIYDRHQGVETITLEPMERFRLAIKLLRKEMAYLSLNTFFNGGSPSYMDLMTAAFEIGIIPASELDELVAMEEIWNPRKTFWQKARVWVATLGTVATVVIPPPYGFLPALAIVVIEYTSGKSDQDEEDPTSLF